MLKHTSPVCCFKYQHPYRKETLAALSPNIQVSNHPVFLTHGFSKKTIQNTALKIFCSQFPFCLLGAILKCFLCPGLVNTNHNNTLCYKENNNSFYWTAFYLIFQQTSFFCTSIYTRFISALLFWTTHTKWRTGQGTFLASGKKKAGKPTGCWLSLTFCFVLFFVFCSYPVQSSEETAESGDGSGDFINLPDLNRKPRDGGAEKETVLEGSADYNNYISPVYEKPKLSAEDLHEDNMIEWAEIFHLISLKSCKDSQDKKP